MGAATGSTSYKGKRTLSPKAIDGGAELEAAVASDAAPLMAAHNGGGDAAFPRARTLNRHVRRRQSGRWQVGLRAKGGGHARTALSVRGDANCVQI
jgi:hypothetical protein